MINTNRRPAALLLVMLLVTGIGSLGADSLKVVATTQWTAAYCYAAGIEDVHVLAPANLQHPPDYELRPSDIPVIMDADLIVYAGYEGMMERIRANVADSDVVLLQITTGYSPMAVTEAVEKIAAAAGTETESAENLKELDIVWEEAREDTEAAGLSWTNAAVHFHQGSFAWTLGIFEVAAFGPTAPSPKQIAEAATSGADLIIDNWHNPVSAPIGEVLPDAAVAELINFPGQGGTVTLQDVIRYNTRQLIAAVEDRKID